MTIRLDNEGQRKILMLGLNSIRLQGTGQSAKEIIQDASVIESVKNSIIRAEVEAPDPAPDEKPSQRRQRQNKPPKVKRPPANANAPK